MKRQNLYFIAILLPEPVSSDVTAFKKDFAKHYNSSRALRVMPHITLKAPFKLDDDEHTSLVSWFNTLSVTISVFQAELKNFGFFENGRNPVIFVKPALSVPLQELQQYIADSFYKAFPGLPVALSEKDFHPHITIAYRDLEKDSFKKAWKKYEHLSYKAAFKVTDFHLLQHNGRQWNPVASHTLVK